MINTKSKKWTVALVLLASVLTLALSLGIVSQSVNESSQLNADGAVPTEILGIVAVDGYTLVGDYWRKTNADGTYGDYAFYQGMTVDAALARIKGVKVKLDNDKEDVLPIGDPATDSSYQYKVTVTITATSTGNNSADNVAVPFTAEIVLDADAEPATTLTLQCDVNFIADRPYAMEWTSGSAPDTSSLGLTSATSITSPASIGVFDGSLRYRLTSGTSGKPVNITEFEVLNSLAPTQRELSGILSGTTTNYAVNVSIGCTAYTNVEPIVFQATNIKYIDPLRMSDMLQGTSILQTTKTAFDFTGLKIRLVYSRTGYTQYADVALTDIIDYITQIQFMDSAYEELGTGKDCLLTTSMTGANITVEIPTTSGKLSQEFYVEFNVAQKLLEQPTVSDLNPTYKDGGTSITITNVLEDTDNPINMAVSDSSENSVAIVDGTVSFDKGGTYTLTMTLTNGISGDYIWNLAGQAIRQDQISSGGSSYTLVYTITVSNAPVDVTLTYTDKNGANREYGDDEPNRTVALSYAGGGSQISGGLTQGSAVDNASNTGAPTYELRYYGGGLTLDQTDSVTGQEYTTSRPTALGTYYVYAATGATDKYAAGRSSAVEFTISPRKLEASSLAKSIPYDGNEHTVDEFVNVSATREDGSPMFVNGDTVTSVINIPDDTFTRVTDTTIALTITNNNYVWSSESETENVRIQITKVDTLSFTVTRDDLTYGQTIANKPESFDSTGLRFGVTVDTANPVYEYTVNGSVWTKVTESTDKVWQAGRYRVTYKTVDKTDGTGGDAATDDYNLPTVREEFVITKKQQTAIELTSNHMSGWYEWSSSVDNVVLLTQYGNTLTTTLNYYPDNNVIAADVGKDPETETVNKIVTYRVELTPHAGESTVVVSSATAAGSFDLTLAGQYIVTISLNENYIWSDGTTEDKVFRGDIDRAILSDFQLSDDTTYDGDEHTVNIAFAVNGSAPSWIKDLLDGKTDIVSVDSITGRDIAAEGKTISDITDGKFSVKLAGYYDVTLSVKDTNNYQYSTDDAISVLTYTVNQALLQGVWTNESPYQYISGADKQAEPTYKIEAIALNETATADAANITPVFTLYDKFYNALSAQKVTEAGTFYKAITSLTSTDKSHLNYKLETEDINTNDRKFSANYKFKRT